MHELYAYFPKVGARDAGDESRPMTAEEFAIATRLGEWMLVIGERTFINILAVNFYLISRRIEAKRRFAEHLHAGDTAEQAFRRLRWEGFVSQRSDRMAA